MLTKRERRQLRRQERAAAAASAGRSQTRRRFLIWGGSILILALVVFGLSRLTNKAPAGPVGTPATVTERDWIKGNREARVTLIEYSDFQCPACGAAFPAVQEIMRELGDRVRFVYRHFPLPQHKQAKLAAAAAEAAGKQNKFWEMHDRLFERQREWSDQGGARELFLGYARDLGLDLNKFPAELDAAEADDKIRADQESGWGAGVNATPTFFLNGVRHTGNFAALRDAVAAAVK